MLRTRNSSWKTATSEEFIGLLASTNYRAYINHKKNKMLFISIIFALSLAIGVFALYAPNVHIWLSKHMDEYEKELERNNPEELKKLKKKHQR